MADVNFMLREAARLTVKNNQKEITPKIIDEIISGLSTDKPTKNVVGFKMNNS